MLLVVVVVVVVFIVLTVKYRCVLQQLMFPNYDHGRFSVIDDGTLVIESVMKEDAGEYVCKGLSIAGSAYAKARLDVRGTMMTFIV